MKSALKIKIAAFIGIILAIGIFTFTPALIFTFTFGPCMGSATHCASGLSQSNIINWATFIYIPFCALTILITTPDSMENDKSKLSKVLKTFFPIISASYFLTILISFFSL